MFTAIKCPGCGNEHPYEDDGEGNIQPAPHIKFGTTSCNPGYIIVKCGTCKNEFDAINKDDLKECPHCEARLMLKTIN